MPGSRPSRALAALQPPALLVHAAALTDPGPSPEEAAALQARTECTAALLSSQRDPLTSFPCLTLSGCATLQPISCSPNGALYQADLNKLKANSGLAPVPATAALAHHAGAVLGHRCSPACSLPLTSRDGSHPGGILPQNHCPGHGQGARHIQALEMWCTAHSMALAGIPPGGCAGPGCCAAFGAVRGFRGHPYSPAQLGGVPLGLAEWAGLLC